MTGFIRGLFNSKAKAKQNGKVEEVPPVKPEKTSKAFFLDADDAKTLGDIDYMRTAKSIRRTFPKTAGGGVSFERVVEISSMQSNAFSTPPVVAPEAIAPPETPEPPKAPDSDNSNQRRTDTSMDMFRNMARDLKRR